MINRAYYRRGVRAKGGGDWLVTRAFAGKSLEAFGAGGGERAKLREMTSPQNHSAEFCSV